ncbi:MAG TPA: EAL domain-containing response regulator [Pedomonas sp.]|uniref:EAL domain-containing response regulator n=1 Tax=Pedomonas sp. TaxID=2976421 RepID=UPI002F3FEF30
MGAIDFLIVDDDPAVCMLIKRVAKGCGFISEAATDADEFRKLYASHVFGAIAVDLSMPDVDGIEILRFLARSDCKSNILIISGFDRRVVDTAWRLGQQLGLRMTGIISKPIDLQTLRSILRQSVAARKGFEPRALPELTTAHIIEAITRGDITLAYQPKIDVASGRLVGVEALARWNHPQLGPIPPAVFIPLAEKLHIIDRLTDHVLEIALHQWGLWHAAGTTIDIAVNISALSLGRLDFPDLVLAKCEKFQVPQHHLIIELTEGATQQAVQLLDTMTRFRLKGVKISLDDYGTGYASLAQLQQLPFNEIKIDRRFVDDADRSVDSRAIVKSVIDLAHNLGLTATAEGVETQSVLTLLAELSCDQAQGYLIAKPMPAADLMGWIEQRRQTSAA